MTRRMYSRRVTASAITAFLVAGGMAACDMGDDNPNEDGHFYCSDANGIVVDEDYCDDSNGGGGGYFFAYMGSSVHGNHSYPVGSRLPAGHQRFAVTDRASRAKFGLPATGRVTNGTVKTGVIGKGGPGSSAKVSGGGKYGGGSGGKSSGG
jgi:hypothetical protein